MVFRQYGLMVVNEMGILGCLRHCRVIHSPPSHNEATGVISVHLGRSQPHLVQPRTSCAITLEIVRLNKCFNEGEFIKNYMTKVVASNLIF